MLKNIRIRADVLIVHGVLALLMGAAFLYVGAAITNLFFEALSVILALTLSAVSLLLAAFTDWLAAIGEGPRRRRSFLLYLGSGLVLAATAIVLGCVPDATTDWLVLLGSGHALVFGTVALFAATRVGRHRSEQRVLALAGIVSILFSGGIAGLAITRASVSQQIAVLGLYLIFAGAKMLFFSWGLHRSALTAIAHARPVFPLGVTPMRRREQI